MPSIAEYPTVAMDAEARSVTSNVFEVTKGEHFQINSLTPYQAAERSSKRKVNNRKNCVKKYSKLFIIVGGLGAILLMCIVCFELLQKISNNERQINAVLQKINQLSEDNRRLELKVRRLQVRMTSHHEQMTSQGDVFEFQARRRRQVDPPKHGQHPDAIIPVPDRARNASFPVLSASRALRPHQEVVPLRPEVRRRRKAGGRGNRKCKGGVLPAQENQEVDSACDLPAIHVHGSATKLCTPGDTVTNLWEVAAWSKHVRKSPAIFNQRNGYLTVKRSGLYWVYAQMTLIVVDKAGFRIKRDDDILTSCKVNGFDARAERTEHVHGDGCNGHLASCTAQGLFYLTKNSRIHLQEYSYTKGAVYTESASYFGLVEFGNFKLTP